MKKVLTPSNTTSSQPPLRGRGVPVFVFSLGLALSFFLASLMHEREEFRLHNTFHQLSQDLAQIFRSEVKNNLGALYSIGDFFASSRFVDREEFRVFCRGILRRNIDIEEIQWAQRVQDNQRQDFEEAAQEETGPDFMITEARDGKMVTSPRRPEYFPIVYEESQTSQQSSMNGFDLASRPDRKKAMQEALRANRAVLTAYAVPQGSLSDEYRCMLFLPVYRNNALTGTIEERRTNLLGFVVESFRLAASMELTLQQFSPRGINLFVYDETDHAKNNLLYHHISRDIPSRNPFAVVFRAIFNRKKLDWESAFDMADRKWLIVCQPTVEFTSRYPVWIPLTTFGAGLIITLLLTGYLSSLLSRSTVIKERVTEQTRELTAVNRQLLRDEEQLEILNQQLRELSDRKSQFVALVGHELRTPLTVIKEVASIVLDQVMGPLNQKQRDFLLKIEKSVDRLTELINNLLDLSKIEAGKIHLARKPVDIRATIESAIDSYKAIAGARTFQTSLAPLPDVYADPNRIFQVLGNLLTNAIKFTPENGTITVLTERQPGCAAVSVRDNGMGIGPEDLPKLFQKFSQVGEIRNRVKGTGLGLALCKELAEMHKGTIHVTSVPAKGTTFTFTLPFYSTEFALQESLEELIDTAKKSHKTILGMIVLKTERPSKTGAGPGPQESVRTQGQTAGKIAAFVRDRIKQEDAVIDIEPDRVAVLSIADHPGLLAIGERLVKDLRDSLNTTATFGIAVYPTDGRDAQSLLAQTSASPHPLETST